MSRRIPLPTALGLAFLGWFAWTFGPSVMAPDITTGTVTAKTVYDVRPDPAKPVKHDYVFQLSDGKKVSEVHVGQATYSRYAVGQHYPNR